MTARAEMEQVNLQELSLENMKSTKGWSKTYVLIQMFIEQLPLVLKQWLFHASNKSDHLQFRLKSPLYSNF